MSQGCWTCRDRKIRCDLQLPTCGNCKQSRRQCLGYGFRLAWPRIGDKRRTLVYALPRRANVRKKWLPRRVCFVNVASNDICLSYELSKSGALLRVSRSQVSEWTHAWNSNNGTWTHFGIQVLPLSNHISWNMLNGNEEPALDYYVKSGSSIFTSLNGDILAPLMLKIATPNGDTASKAVLHSILALSCLHMGHTAKAAAYRASSVSLLSASLRAGSSVKVAFQNIATSMLLCMFEVYHVSDTSANWAIYLCGTKKIIMDALVHRKIYDRECIALKDWIYFYEVLARFGLLHWIGRPERLAICYQGPASHLIQVGGVGASMQLGRIGYSRKAFESIDALASLLLPSSVSHWTGAEYEKKVTSIESRLRALLQHSGQHTERLLDDNGHKSATIDHLYLLAALIYLDKSVLKYTGDEVQHRILVEEGVSHLNAVQISEAPLPFFIIGCEAHTDSQRLQVLRYSLSAGDGEVSDNAMWIRRLVESYWNQDDLDVQQSLSYVQKICGVISACPFLPVFV